MRTSQKYYTPSPSRTSINAVPTVTAGGGAGGLAVLVMAHSRYVSDMRRNMFLGSDRSGVVARGHIEEFYHAVCAIGRVTDRVVVSTTVARGGSSSGGGGFGQEFEGGRASRGRRFDGGDRIRPSVFSDRAYGELVSAWARYDVARKGLCDALKEMGVAGDGSRTRPLLAVIGYKGYG